MRLAFRSAALVCMLLLLNCFAFAGQRRSDEQRRGDELADHFRKWLNEDVLYIIADEERDVFLQLSTDEEREAFVEQFWLRRDPDPSTTINEFKIEHYRRIAYANDRFQSGEPGWKTDRGEMYIKFGPPSAIESHPSSGPYARRLSEGGGRTVTYPFERWRYNYIEGVGPNIEIEFVDPSGTGEYRIALSPQDKDKLLYVSTMYAGNTEAEDMGLEDRWMRITRDAGLGIQSRSGHYTIHPDDFPYERLQRLGKLQKAPPIRFRDLRAEVTSRVTFDTLPFSAAATHIRLSGDRYLVPLTVEIPNKVLTYRRNEQFYEARVQVYGSITDPSRKTWHEFDHDLVNHSSADQLPAETERISVFQKTVTLPPGRYKIELFAKEVNGSRLGLIQQSLHLPAADADESLGLSPIVLADLVEKVEGRSQEFSQFHLGGLKVVPNVARTFGRNDLLNVYLQAYNVRLDQGTLEPALEIRYFVMRGSRMVLSFPDVDGRSISYASPRRVVLTTAFRLGTLEPGKYRLLVRLKDRISGMDARTEAPFTVRQ